MGGAAARTGIDRRRTVWLGTAALFVLQLWVSSGVSGPSVVFDEAGYLGNARWLAGNHNWTMPSSPMYSLAYPALLAPAFRLLQQPDDQWQVVLVVNAALLATLFPLLIAVLRRVFQVPWRAAVIGAGLGAMVPAAFAAAGSAIAENLVLPLVLANLLAARAAADRTAPRWHRLWFGATTVALLASHPRFTVAVPLALAFLAVAYLRIDRDRVITAANAAVLVAGSLAVRAANQRFEAARWVHVERLEGGADDWWSLVSSWSGRGELALGALGQAWYLAVGSVGLALIGIVVAVRALRRTEVPAAPDETTGPAGAGDEPVPSGPLPASSRAAVVWVLALASSVFATSVAFFSMNQFRVDHYVYGRHNDSFAPLWVAAGMAFLVATRAHRRRLTALAGAAVAMVVLGLAVAIARDSGAFEGAFSPFGSPAITWAMEARPDRGFALATVVGLAVLCGAVALIAWDERGRRSPARTLGSLIAVAVLVGAWFAFDGRTATHDTATFATLNTSRWIAPAAIERLEVDELSLDAAATRSRGVLNYPFYLPQIRFLTYDSSRNEQPPTTYALARTTDPQRRAAGDRIVVLDQGGLFGDEDTPEGMAVWVRPGPEQDRLAAAGRLLPADFPSAIPASAREADLEIEGLPEGPVEVPAGGRIPLRVRLRSAGTGSPWPDATSFGLPGRVRVGARVTALDAGHPDGANSGGELPFWMLPGDEAHLDAGVMALDPLLEPLPTGRYEVELTLTQEGFGWETDGGADATFTMVVTPPPEDPADLLGG